MRIWIDGYEANVLERLGSGQVAFELLRNIEAIDKKNEYTILLPGQPLFDLPKEREGWYYKILKPKRLWTFFALPLALHTVKYKPDIFFSPTQYLPRFSPKNIKKIVTIFDLAYLYFPEMFQKKDLLKLKNWSRFSINNANHIITISDFSKQDIIKNYQISKEKITVAYPGKNEIFKPIKDKQSIEQVLKKYNIGKNYIIYIGTVQPRKNLVRLIDAVSKIENLQLLIVGKTFGQGKSGWGYQKILQRPKELNVDDRVKFLGYVPDEDLLYLLNGSMALVLVSLYEGFGIPVVDAMICGIPVIVSNVSSLPEVVGKGGLLVDPNSVDQIEQAIRTITTDKRLHNKLSKEDLKQAQRFSWKKMANTILRIFEEI